MHSSVYQAEGGGFRRGLHSKGLDQREAPGVIEFDTFAIRNGDDRA